MTKISDASLKGKAKALAKKHGLMAQEIMQMHLFDRLLWRLARSPYADNTILKGGLLIASMAGVSQRTTMDMDATVQGLPVDEAHIEAMVKELCALPSDDSIVFSFERIEPIREDDEYANFRVHLRTSLGKTSTPLKIDITTGDIITPAAIRYLHHPILGDEPIPCMVYPVPTIIAEKFETIISRGATNGRARDFYDISLLFRLYGEEVSWTEVHEAVDSTAEKRGSSALMSDYLLILKSIRESNYMRNMIWNNYAADNPYAASISFDDTINATVEIGKRMKL